MSPSTDPVCGMMVDSGEAAGLVAVKFGEAGSGGLEYEPLPEAHDDGQHNDRQDDR